MKYLSILFLSLVLLSCSKEKEEEDNTNCIEVEFNQEFSAIIDDEICLPDGNSFVIKNIEDVFCPCLAHCVWQGELSVLVETTNTVGNKDLFRFGSETFEEDPDIISNIQLKQFTYEYQNGTLPDCEGDYDINRVTINLILTEG